MDVFVYGTLRDEALRGIIAGNVSDVVPAILRGYAVRPVAGDVVPMIVPTPDAVTPGLLLQGLIPMQMDRLALYEGAFGYDLITVTVALADGRDAEALMWLPPDTLTPGTGDWSLTDWQARCGRTSRIAAEELFFIDPLPTAGDLRWQYPMVLKRAWNTVCAESEVRPARLRHDAALADFGVPKVDAPVGRFFRLQGFDVTHRRFDGSTQGPLPREVFVGIDAVLVLPYDLSRDRVVLVEQIRMGALRRGDRNPWVLEPVAGMIDAFETPEQAALRETQEEAGLSVTLRHVSSFYPSPGNATDFFYTYIGLCDIPDVNCYAGGLASEHEDLRLHVLSLDAALTLVETGEIAAGPGIMLLYWLALHREALRLEFATPAP